MSFELFQKLYIVLMCVNITLIVGGISPMYESGSAMNLTSYESNPSDPGDLQGMMGWLKSAANVIFLGGVMAVLASSGMPVEVQWLIGIPIMTLAFFGLLPVIEAIVKQVFGLVGLFLGR